MDLEKAIQELQIEKNQIERAISLLEDLYKAHGNPALAVVKRRGRKAMGQDERREVSRRMKSYWENRRKPSRK